jgi:hypothetical protein
MDIALSIPVVVGVALVMGESSAACGGQRWRVATNPMGI